MKLCFHEKKEGGPFGPAYAGLELGKLAAQNLLLFDLFFPMRFTRDRQQAGRGFYLEIILLKAWNHRLNNQMVSFQVHVHCGLQIGLDETANQALRDE